LDKFFSTAGIHFSVGAYLCDQPEHVHIEHIVGGLKTGPLASKRQFTYATNTHYIDSPLGGYGLYYRTVMAELGLIYLGGSGYPVPVDVMTEYGKEVAAAFRQAIFETDYYKTYFSIDDYDIPIEIIEEYIRSACLCQLQKKESVDHSYLMDVFLHKGNSTASKARRDTFRLLLDIAHQTQGTALNEEKFRQLIYFNATEDGLRIFPSPELEEVYARWRLYQAREYYAFALNSLWYYLCEWGILQNGDLIPVPISRFWEHIDEYIQFDDLANEMGIPQSGVNAFSGFQSLEEWLLSLTNSTRGSFDKACGIHSSINEDKLYRLAIGSKNHPKPGAMMTGMVAMLALIHLRYNIPDLWIKPEWEISKMGSDGRLSLDGFLNNLSSRLRSGPVTIAEILRWIYEKYVIYQHQLVCYGKLPDNTFRFKREGNRLHFNKLDNTLNFMNSRFEALSTTIHELGLCGDLFLTEHTLTTEGNMLLQQGDYHG
jgi:hypothetical protein